MEDYQVQWNQSFQSALEDDAANSIPPEALVREVSYFLRRRHKPSEYGQLRALDAGCGVGPMTRWFAKKGIFVSGVDVSDVALRQCDFLNKKELLREEYLRIGLTRGSLVTLPLENDFFDVVVEANVVQHLSKYDRQSAFNEIFRVLKPGGVFIAQQQGWHSTARQLGDELGCEVEGDRFTYVFPDIQGKTSYHLTDFPTHFFTRGEYLEVLPAFSQKDIHELSYEIPVEEARNRGCEVYRNKFYLLYCIK